MSAAMPVTPGAAVFFLRDPLHPVAGTITVPNTGLGLAIDESKVTAERQLNFRAD